jgi:leader peptidase (prepilin peptidase) / N-methyltransferase
VIIAAWWALGGATAGLVAGSFISTLVIRWPQGRTLTGRSTCDGCQRTLAFQDLIPILSWLLGGRKCRTCGKKIDWRHPAIEALCALIGAVALVACPGATGIAGALFGWELLALAALDAEHFWLPDRLTAVLAASGLAFGVIGIGVDLPSRLIGGTVGFGTLWFIASTYRRIRGREGLGGGDPKLLGAIGCWMGWQALPFVLVGASGLGLLAASVMLARRQQVAADTRLPLGALMAVAAFPLWVLFSKC